MATVNKQLNACLTIVAAKSRVVGCTFVTKMLVIWQVLVMSKMLFIGERAAQNVAGYLRL